MKIYAILGTTILIACNSNTDKAPMVNDATTDIQNEDVLELPNPSDIAFEKALEYYVLNKFDSTSLKIDESIALLKEEGKDLRGEQRTQLDKSIVSLEKASKLLISNPGKELKPQLEEVINQAEVELAHNYFYLSEEYLIEQPDKSAVYLKRGMKHLKYLEKR
jgi:hypothetical protein